MRMFWQKRKEVKDKNWIDDYAPTDRAEADYFFDRPGAKRPAPEKKLPKKNGWKVGVGVFAAAAILAGTSLAVADVLRHRTVPSKQQTPVISRGSLTGNDEGGVSRQQRDFTASSGYLKLTYPSDWRVQETTGAITLRSPVHQIKTGQSTTKGLAELSIRPKQGSTPAAVGWETGDAHAMASSQTIVYTSPGPQQRAQTNLTFVRFPGNQEETADAAFLTGPTAYAMSQTVDKVALSASDPLVSLRAVSCRDGESCTATEPMRLSVADWQADSRVADARSIIASFVLQ